MIEKNQLDLTLYMNFFAYMSSDISRQTSLNEKNSPKGPGYVREMDLQRTGMNWMTVYYHTSSELRCVLFHFSSNADAWQKDYFEIACRFI